MLYRFFLLLLLFTYVFGYINGWQSYNTTKLRQGGVNQLLSCLETARLDFIHGFLLLPVRGDVRLYFWWESMGERHQMIHNQKADQSEGRLVNNG